MKYLMLLMLLYTCINVKGQELPAQDSLFMVSYTTGPSWDTSKPPNEQIHFAEHSKHLSDLRKNGTIKLGARAGEEGIIIFSAKNKIAAKELINSDVAIANGLFKTDIKKFNVFYFGCIER